MLHFGLIGKTLAHSYSKRYFEATHDSTKCDYTLIETNHIDQIRSLAVRSKLSGFNVTIPYKQTIIPYLDALDPIAQAIGAVNTVVVTIENENGKENEKGNGYEIWKDEGNENEDENEKGYGYEIWKEKEEENGDENENENENQPNNSTNQQLNKSTTQKPPRPGTQASRLRQQPNDSTIKNTTTQNNKSTNQQINNSTTQNNTSTTLKGYNTDAPAFQQTLLAHYRSTHSPLPEAALVLGTGGAALAVAWALQQIGIACRLVSRNPQQARQAQQTQIEQQSQQAQQAQQAQSEQLSQQAQLEESEQLEQLNNPTHTSNIIHHTSYIIHHTSYIIHHTSNIISYQEAYELAPTHHLIVNATPVGTAPHIDDTPWERPDLLSPRHVCYDLVYNPDQTRFLREASQAGAATINGLAMLYAQAQLSYRLWNLE